jgi:hypothetical protein
LLFKNYDISINTNPFTGNVAAIKAVAQTNFASGSGARTALLFFTADETRPSASGPVQLLERMRISETGRVGIGTTTPADKLHVDGGALRIQNGTGVSYAILAGRSTDGRSELAFRNNAASSDLARIVGQTSALSIDVAGSERARIDSSGRLLVGTSSGYGIASSGLAKFQVGSTAAELHASLTDWSTLNQGGVLAFGAARGGAAGDYTIVQNGDSLGSLRFAGADGTDLQTQAAAISAQVDGTPGANDMPGRLVFSTTADGASSPTERMRITSDAYVRLAAGTGGIQFNGDTAAANALDDYEEGTWTPTSTSGAYAAASGTYTKIGRVVTLNFSVTFPASGMTQLARLGSIPFSVAQAGSSSTTTDAGIVIRTVFNASTPTFIRLTNAAGVSQAENSLYGNVVSGTLTYFA